MTACTWSFVEYNRTAAFAGDAFCKMNTASSDPTSDGFVHEFKFVSDKSAESRKLIRTHVMREHKRREKWQGARKGNRPGNSLHGVASSIPVLME